MGGMRPRHRSNQKKRPPPPLRFAPLQFSLGSFRPPIQFVPCVTGEPACFHRRAGEPGSRLAKAGEPGGEARRRAKANGKGNRKPGASMGAHACGGASLGASRTGAGWNAFPTLSIASPRTRHVLPFLCPLALSPLPYSRSLSLSRSPFPLSRSSPGALSRSLSPGFALSLSPFSLFLLFFLFFCSLCANTALMYRFLLTLSLLTCDIFSLSHYAGQAEAVAFACLAVLTLPLFLLSAVHVLNR